MNKYLDIFIVSIKKMLINHGMLIFISFNVVFGGYIFYKTYLYKNNTPAINSNQPKALKIDKQTVDKLNSLKDNSVEVRAIFNNARDNPF